MPAAAQKYVDRKLSALALYRRSSLTSLPDRIRISQKSVRTSLRSTTRVRLQRGTARIRPPLLQSIDISCISGPQPSRYYGFAAVEPRWDKQTDGHHAVSVYPALHIMQAVPIHYV